MHRATQTDFLSEGLLCSKSLHNPENESLTKSISSIFPFPLQVGGTTGVLRNLPLKKKGGPQRAQLQSQILGKNQSLEKWEPFAFLLSISFELLQTNSNNPK